MRAPVLLVGFVGLWSLAQCSSPTTESTERSCLLGGSFLFRSDGATASQCQSRGERLWECEDGQMKYVHRRVKGRVSGPCHAVTLRNIGIEDCDQEYSCTVLEGGFKGAVHNYIKTGAITAPPHEISVINNTLFWQPPPPQQQTKPIHAFKVKWSCNSTEGSLETTVSGNSTILREMLPGVCCNVTVTAVSSDGLGDESDPETFCIPTQGSPLRENLSRACSRTGLYVSVAFLALALICLGVACCLKSEKGEIASFHPGIP